MSDIESKSGDDQRDLDEELEDDSEEDEEWVPASNKPPGGRGTRGRGSGRGPGRPRVHFRGHSRGRGRGRGRGRPPKSVLIPGRHGPASSASGHPVEITDCGDTEEDWQTAGRMSSPATETSSLQIFVCELCDCKFDAKEKLLQHKQSTHSTTPSGSSNTADADSAPAEPAPAGVVDEERRSALSKFTDEQILAKLAERGAAFVCLCGVIFKDKTLYYLHRGCHNTNDPLKCSFCGYAAKDWYDFHTHFLVHKKTAAS